MIFGQFSVTKYLKNEPPLSLLCLILTYLPSIFLYPWYIENDNSSNKLQSGNFSPPSS